MLSCPKSANSLKQVDFILLCLQQSQFNRAKTHFSFSNNLDTPSSINIKILIKLDRLQWDSWRHRSRTTGNTPSILGLLHTSSLISTLPSFCQCTPKYKDKDSNTVCEKEQRTNKKEVKLEEGKSRRCRSINMSSPASNINPWAKNRGNNKEQDLNINRV